MILQGIVTDVKSVTPLQDQARGLRSLMATAALDGPRARRWRAASLRSASTQSLVAIAVRCQVELGTAHDYAVEGQRIVKPP